MGGKNLQWRETYDVDGGTVGVCQRSSEGSEYFEPNPPMGQQCEPCHGRTAHSVDTESENEHYELPGDHVSGRGPGLDFRLGYNSLDAVHDTPFGHGWRSSYDMALSDNDDHSRTVFQETEHYSEVITRADRTRAACDSDDDVGEFLYRPRYRVAMIFQFLRWAMARSTAERMAEISALTSFRLSVRS